MKKGLTINLNLEIRNKIGKSFADMIMNLGGEFWTRIFQQMKMSLNYN